VFGAIGIPAGQMDPKGRIFYRTKTGSFGITKPIDGQAATHANGGTIGFSCSSPEQAKAFHDAGVANGGKSIEDPPGWREGAAGKLYVAYLRDPSATRSARCTAAERAPLLHREHASVGARTCLGAFHLARLLTRQVAFEA